MKKYSGFIFENRKYQYTVTVFKFNTKYPSSEMRLAYQEFRLKS